MPEPVTYYSSDTPELPKEQQYFFANLKKILTTGTSQITAATIAVDNGKLRLGFGQAYTFKVGQTVEVEGATPASVNGRTWIESITNNEILLNTPVTTAPTGTITVKSPKSDWEVPFEDIANNKMVIRAKTGSRMYYALETDQYSTLWVKGYTSMSDLTTGTERFAKVFAKHPFHGWDIVADARTLYLVLSTGLDTRPNLVVIGDILSEIPDDPFCGVAMVGTATGIIARSYDLITKKPEFRYALSRVSPYTLWYGHSTNSGTSVPAFGTDIYYMPLLGSESLKRGIRGRFPGIYLSSDVKGVAHLDNPVTPKLFIKDGNPYLFVSAGHSNTTDLGANDPAFSVAIQLTPWR